MKRRYKSKVDSLESFLSHGESVAQKSVALLKEKSCAPSFLPGPAGDVECLAYLCALDDVAKEIKGWAHETCKRLISEHQKTRVISDSSPSSIPFEAIRDINRKGEFASLMLDRVHKTLGKNSAQASLVAQTTQSAFKNFDVSFSEARKKISLLEQENMLMALQQGGDKRGLLLNYTSSMAGNFSEVSRVDESNVLESTSSELVVPHRLGPRV